MKMVTLHEKLPLTVAIFYTPREFSGRGWREEFLLAKCRALGIEFIDTKPILQAVANRDGQEIQSYYKPDDHLNERGNAVMAQAFAQPAGRAADGMLCLFVTPPHHFSQASIRGKAIFASS